MQQSLDELLEENLSKQPNSLLNNINTNTTNPTTIVNQNDFLTEEELLKKTLELSKKENKNNNFGFSGNKEEESIQFIIEQGYTMEEAVMAISAVGYDPELMLKFLYSHNI